MLEQKANNLSENIFTGAILSFNSSLIACLILWELYLSRLVSDSLHNIREEWKHRTCLPLFNACNNPKSIMLL